MKSSKKILLGSVISLSSIFIATSLTVSCSSSKTDSEDNKEPDNQKSELQKLVEQKQIVIKINPVISISKKIFDEYRNDRNEIVKMFKLYNNTDLNVGFQILSLPQWDESDKSIKCKFQIFNKDNKETYDFEMKFENFNFASNEEYIREANKIIVENIYLKTTYQNIRIIDLFKNIKTSNDFISKYIDYERAIENIIGISFELNIPTQTMRMDVQDNNYFKFTIKLFDKKSGNEITPSNSTTIPYLNIQKNSLKDTFTIIDSEDLKKQNLLESTEYLGKVFILNNKNNTSELFVNVNLSDKNILGQLDFSSFSKITFSDSARFDRNKITSLVFNDQSTVIGLNQNKFKFNLITSFTIPQMTTNFSYSCFDENVEFLHANNITLISNIIDQNNNLNLRSIKNENELKNVLEILESSNKIKFNNIYLPEIQSIILNEYSLSCKEIIFFEKTNQEPYEFNTRLTNWNIETINIPKFIYKIDRNFSNCLSIKREFNDETLSFIDKNNVLTINTTVKYSWWNVNTNLWTEIKNSNLDDYFYSFNSSPLEIKEVKINQNSQGSISTNQWEFFKKSKEVNKKIIFDSNVNFVDVNSYYNLKSMSSDIKIERLLENNVSYIQNQVLYLEKLYKNKPTEENLNKVLVGHEDKINSIDTTNVIEIRKNLFNSLKWEKLIINLKNIQVVGDYAFYNSNIQINTEGFNPISINNYAFYNSQIKGDLIFNNLNNLGASAFYGTKYINSILFNQLETIPLNCFYSSSITKISSTSIKTIDSYAFYSSKINMVELPNLITINNYAFYSTQIKTIDLSKVTTIGDYAFQSCNNLSGNIVLNQDVKLGLNIFRCSTKIESINNFNFNDYSIINNISEYINDTNIIISNSIPDEQLYSILNYDISTGILDLSNLTNNKLTDSFINNLILLMNKLKKNNKSTINEVILPSDSEISPKLKWVFKSMIIKKLTWNSMNFKIMTSNLNNLLQGATIYSINKDFCVGMKEVIYSFNSSIKVSNINLKGVKKIGDRVFSYFENTIFSNTQEVKEIGSQAFSQSCIFDISTDVKLKEDSFTEKGIVNNPNYKITRKKIFSGEINFQKIYDEKTKILNFSKIESKTPNDYNELINFRNISDYLLNGDVFEIILPKVYIVGVQLYSNLGNVSKITFQQENQVIESKAFESTNVENKPKLEQTHIIVDEDNFLSY